MPYSEEAEVDARRWLMLWQLQDGRLVKGSIGQVMVVLRASAEQQVWLSSMVHLT